MGARDTLSGAAALDWSYDTVITSWEGVTTGGTPSRVTELRFITRGLTGSIPPELGQLSNLTRLALRRDELTGEIPGSLGSLSNLTVLSLDRQRLTGEIPGSLGSLSNLTWLRLTGNSFTGCIPSALRDVANNDLSSLGLPYCDAAPPAPGGLAVSLSDDTFTASWSPVAGADEYEAQYRVPGTLDAWTSVDTTTSASLEFSPVGGASCEATYEFRVLSHGDGATYVAEWSSPSSVVSVTTDACNREPEFAVSTHRLVVADDAAIGDSVVSVSASDPDDDTLTYSITGGNGDGAFTIGSGTGEVTVAGVLKAASVLPYTLTVEADDGRGGTATVTVTVYVTLCANGVVVPNADSNPGLVRDCTMLLGMQSALAGDATLNWGSGISITQWQGVALGGTPRRVWTLILSGLGLSGSIPPELGELTELARLDLDDNELTGEIRPELGSLDRLETLYLFDNQLSGEIPTELSDLSSLEILYLSGNRLTGGIPPELGRLANLRQLVMDGNLLEGAIPSELGSLSSLSDLWLRNNLLTGAIPAALENLANLGNLFLDGNGLTGCIPAGLRTVANNDLALLGLPYCGASAP